MQTPDGSPANAPSAATDLFAEVYARLKAMAAKQLAGAGATLETTALVHELYLRMCANRDLAFEQESQFFAYAARAMRHLLSDRARARLRQRAGGEWSRVTLTGGDRQFAIESAEQALALDAALERLEATDARAARVFELLFFAGLTIDQVAAALAVGASSVDRDWRFARAFLRTQLAR